MRAVSVLISARVLTVALGMCWTGLAVAQELPPPVPVEGSAAMIGRERILAEILSLEPTGEPTVSATTDKNAVILSAPLRLRDEGRLGSDIATQSYRMSAGAPVMHREFKPSYADESEAIQAWCGPGETRTMFGWSGGSTVCMVHTADGKANLGTPQLNFGSWWTATNVSFTSPDARTERVAVEPAATPSPFRLIVVYERLRSDGIAIHTSIEGPGMTADARPYRYRMQRRTLPLKGGSTEMIYDGLKLSLTPQQRGDILATTAERLTPPIDMTAFQARIEDAVTIQDDPSSNAAAEKDVSANAQSIAPTPFVIGGVKLDPTALTVGEGVLGRGDVVLSGPATHALTARLTKPLTLRAPLVNDTSPEGTILHQLEFAQLSSLGTRTMTRVWCGPIMQPTLFSGGRRETLCLRRTGASADWEAYIPMTGRPWLGTTLTPAAAARYTAKNLEFETSTASLLDSLSVRAEIQRLRDDSITLRFFARQKDEDALIMTVTTEFENGVATINLWTHRLLLTRSGEGVIASLSPNNTGGAPSDDGIYP